MRIGAMIGGETADEVGGKARDLEERGFDSVWIGNFLGYGFEALTAMTLIARQTKRIELGTAVVPIYFHHPRLWPTKLSRFSR